MKTLTLGETAEVESIAGLPIDALKDESAPKAKLAAGIVFVIKKRENKDFTIKDAFEMDAGEAADILSEFFGDEDPK